MAEIEMEVVAVEKPGEMNMILGQSHFIKTVEDIHEAVSNAGGGIRFGLAFCEASGPKLVRHTGNDDELVQLAVDNARKLGAGHSFILFMKDGFPINILNNIKAVPEVCRIYCATANPVQVLIAETQQGRGIVGVIDGGSPKGVEQPDDIDDRKQLLRQLGYKK